MKDPYEVVTSLSRYIANMCRRPDYSGSVQTEINHDLGIYFRQWGVAMNILLQLEVKMRGQTGHSELVEKLRSVHIELLPDGEVKSFGELGPNDVFVMAPTTCYKVEDRFIKLKSSGPNQACLLKPSTWQEGGLVLTHKGRNHINDTDIVVVVDTVEGENLKYEDTAA